MLPDVVHKLIQYLVDETSHMGVRSLKTLDVTWEHPFTQLVLSWKFHLKRNQDLDPAILSSTFTVALTLNFDSDLECDDEASALFRCGDRINICTYRYHSGDVLNEWVGSLFVRDYITLRHNFSRH